MTLISERLIRMEYADEITSWYAMQTKRRFETKVAAQLQNKGVETYVPSLSEIRRWSDRSISVETPLFSGYGFARLSSFNLKSPELLRTNGLIGFVTFAGAARAVPNQQIEQLRKLLAVKVPCSLHEYLKVGRRVRVRGGCLDGIEGILTEHAENSLVISVTSIERSVSVEINGYELEVI